jgi:hypothetical protein
VFYSHTKKELLDLSWLKSNAEVVSAIFNILHSFSNMVECTEDFLTDIFTKKETFANNHFDLLLKIKDNIGKITTITHLFGGLVSLLKTRKWEQVHRVSDQVKRSYDALLRC